MYVMPKQTIIELETLMLSSLREKSCNPLLFLHAYVFWYVTQSFDAFVQLLTL